MVKLKPDLKGLPVLESCTNFENFDGACWNDLSCFKKFCEF